MVGSTASRRKTPGAGAPALGAGGGGGGDGSPTAASFVDPKHERASAEMGVPTARVPTAADMSCKMSEMYVVWGGEGGTNACRGGAPRHVLMSEMCAPRRRVPLFFGGERAGERRSRISAFRGGAPRHTR